MCEPGEPIPTAGEDKDQTQGTWPDRERRRAGMLRTLARLSIGGTLLAVEALTDRLRQLEQEPVQDLPEQGQMESVLIPTDEWETTVGNATERPARHIALGFALGSQSRLSRAGATLQRAESAAQTTMDRALNPLRTSRILAPIRGRIQTLVERGQAEVTRWAELGRAEEALSRQLAQTALNQVAESAVDELAESPRIHILIQGFVQEQSLSLTDATIEEMRERTVTGDIRLERFLRSRLGRQPRESLPAPTSTVDKPAQPETRGRE